MDRAKILESLQASIGPDSSARIGESNPVRVIVYRPDEISDQLIEEAVESLRAEGIVGASELSAVTVAFDSRLGTTCKRIRVKPAKA